jgi:hypothetical protein
MFTSGITFVILIWLHPDDTRQVSLVFVLLGVGVDSKLVSSELFFLVFSAV